MGNPEEFRLTGDVRLGSLADNECASVASASPPKADMLEVGSDVG